MDRLKQIRSIHQIVASEIKVMGRMVVSTKGVAIITPPSQQGFYWLHLSQVGKQNIKNNIKKMKTKESEVYEKGF